ncbi:MAG TPA: SagB/ThcOx family dehydrogenase [Burkholderiales bacterium]|nr:SagB/ThcOx family dehydrogenase [Burkholderiales bacterium]
MPHAAQLEAVMRYHERTKHHFNRFAAGPGGLDWANQPDPFRRYKGAPLTRLPILGAGEEPRSPRYHSLYAPGAVPAAQLSVRALSRLLEYALALSAWKQAGGTRWALRANPSSGNLHPTEGYVLIGGIAELGETPGLFHYAPREHALERRADCPAALFERLMRGFPPQAFLAGLSSVHWREAWKYGERAFRYCQHDIGHAIGTLRIAAATLGWSAAVLDEVADATIEALLGLDRAADFEGAERESAELVMAVWPSAAAKNKAVPLHLDPQPVKELAEQRWYGKANRLSLDDPLPWEIIDAVSAASRKP